MSMNALLMVMIMTTYMISYIVVAKTGKFNVLSYTDNKAILAIL